MEHEGDRGTSSLLFHGGTSHSMQSAFPPSHVVDLVGLSTSLPVRLLQYLVGKVRNPKGFLVQMLAGGELQWHVGIEVEEPTSLPSPTEESLIETLL